MDFKTFFLGLSNEQRHEFAAGAGTTLNYLRQMAYGNKRVSLGLADAIVKRSGGMVDFESIPLAPKDQLYAAVRKIEVPPVTPRPPGPRGPRGPRKSPTPINHVSAANVHELNDALNRILADTERRKESVGAVDRNRIDAHNTRMKAAVAAVAAATAATAVAAATAATGQAAAAG